jgi:hypothetical protein
MKLARRPCPRCGAIDTKTVVLTVGGSLLATSLSATLVIELLLLNLGVGFLMPMTLLLGAAGGVGIGAAVTAWLWRTRWSSSRWQLAPGGSRGG